YTTRRKDLADESIPYRFVGVSDGTTLVYDPPITGAPATLSSGQVADFETTGSFIVKSHDASHPFAVGPLMTGGAVPRGRRPGCGGPGPSGLGAEEYVDVLPPKQYPTHYVFFTDPTYPTTNLVFVRKKTASGFHDVTLDCAGTLGRWTAMGTSGEY